MLNAGMLRKAFFNVTHIVVILGVAFIKLSVFLLRVVAPGKEVGRWIVYGTIFLAVLIQMFLRMCLFVLLS